MAPCTKLYLVLDGIAWNQIVSGYRKNNFNIENIGSVLIGSGEMCLDFLSCACARARV